MEGESTPVGGGASHEPALEAEPDATAGSETAEAAAPGIVGIALDAARLRDRAFVASAGRPDLTVPALIVAGGAILATSLAGWLYLKFDDFGPLPSGRIVFREVVAGTVLMFVLWLAWVLVVETLLGRRGFEVNRAALIRSMGFACVPLLFSLLMVIPILAFGAALIAIAAWVVASERAIAAAVPAASASDRNIANLAGFAVLALSLGAIAFQTGMAPGPFVFMGLWELLN